MKIYFCLFYACVLLLLSETALPFFLRQHKLESENGTAKILSDGQMDRNQTENINSTIIRRRYGPSELERAKVREILKELGQYLKREYLKNETGHENFTDSFIDQKLNEFGHMENVTKDKLHFEEDILLTLDQAKAMYDYYVHKKDRRKKRKFVDSQVKKWDPNVPIEYSFDGSHDFVQQKDIEYVLKYWQDQTCLNFKRSYTTPPNSGYRLVFTKNDGCLSIVGRSPYNQPQDVSLANICIKLGIIAHEIGHALGLWHEQSRPDREKHVTILWKNVRDDEYVQFRTEHEWDVYTANIPYDMGSVMHYRSRAYAKRPDLYTIETKNTNYQFTIGQRDQLSFNDVRLVNSVYCSRKCPVKLDCKRDGYTDPRHCYRCKCPDGFAGRFCERVMPGYKAFCGGEVHLNQFWTSISSPNYPKNFESGQECTWLLKAQPGHVVELQFVGLFRLYCDHSLTLCHDFVEVRHTTDFSNTGMRFCCGGAPTEIFHSVTNEMLILFRSFYLSTTGFSARARSVPLWQALHGFI